MVPTGVRHTNIQSTTHKQHTRCHFHLLLYILFTNNAHRKIIIILQSCISVTRELTLGTEADSMVRNSGADFSSDGADGSTGGASSSTSGQKYPAHDLRIHTITLACSGPSPSLFSGILQLKEVVNRAWRSERKQWLYHKQGQICSCQ